MMLCETASCHWDTGSCHLLYGAVLLSKITLAVQRQLLLFLTLIMRDWHEILQFVTQLCHFMHIRYHISSCTPNDPKQTCHSLAMVSICYRSKNCWPVYIWSSNMAVETIKDNIRSMLQEIMQKLNAGNLRADEIDYIYFKLDRVKHILSLSVQVTDIDARVFACISEVKY